MKENKRILIISPAFPSAINGLGDYSSIVGNMLVNFNQIQISYAGLPQTDPVNVEPYYEINSKNTIAEIATKNQIGIIFLSYVNYGYQKKGVPFWLLTQLKNIKSHRIKLLTFFHEVYASGRPWQSVFWLKPLQKYIFQKIYSLSDKCFCNTERVLQIMSNEGADSGKKAKNIGIFSNIDEPQQLIPWTSKKNVAVIFGSYRKRKAIFNKKESLQKIASHYFLNEIIDIGEGEIPSDNVYLKITKLGKLNSNEVSFILNNSKLGLIDYNESLLGKSGIFAAYASHGLAIINLNENHETPKDGLVKNKHYGTPESLYESNPKELAKNAEFWYKGKNRRKHLKEILKAIYD